MDESESIYLDFVRFTAAVCVVVNHFLHNDILHPAIVGAIPDFGREAVMVFFLLSGYVICYTTETRCERYAQLSWILSFSNPIRALATYTFTLYLVHTLLIFTWLRNFTYDRTDLLHCMAMVGLIAVVTWGVGELTEKRKPFFVRITSLLADAIERTLRSRSRITRLVAPSRSL